MSPENFVYWLQGFFELTDSKNLSESQIQVIKNHLVLVFDKKTPDVPVLNPFPAIPPKLPADFKKDWVNEKPWVTLPKIPRTPWETTPYPYTPPTITC